MFNRRIRFHYNHHNKTGDKEQHFIYHMQSFLEWYCWASSFIYNMADTNGWSQDAVPFYNTTGVQKDRVSFTYFQNNIWSKHGCILKTMYWAAVTLLVHFIDETVTKCAAEL